MDKMTDKGKNRAKRRRRRPNRHKSSMLAVSAVLLLLVAVVCIDGMRFRAKDKEYQAQEQELERQIEDRGLTGEVTLTGFVDNAERNALYKYSRAFLFPSVFEGFGMPPIEAMLFGTVVITTKRTCIPEVTQDRANYVSDPYDVQEWIRVMSSPVDRISEVDFSAYDQKRLTRQYFELLSRVLQE